MAKPKARTTPRESGAIDGPMTRSKTAASKASGVSPTKERKGAAATTAAEIVSLGSEKMIPTGLSDEETVAYQTLIRIAAKRVDAGHKPQKLVAISDLAKDYDDLAAMVVLKELDRLKIVQLQGVVANLMPAKKRAEFGRGALDSLGLQRVLVAEGLPAADKEHAELAYEFQCSFMAAEGSVTETGEQLLYRLFKAAVQRNEKITLVCLSSLADIAEFCQKYPSLVKNALGLVIMQGAYNWSEDGHLVPDEKATNNRIFMAGARSFHTFIQENHIASIAYTKEAAFATPLYSQLFASLAETNHPVGLHLRRVQVEQDLAFYKRACLEDPAARFAPYFDQEFFLRNKSTWFDTHSDEETRPLGEDVVPYLTKVVVYDALAALGAAGSDVLKALNVITVPDANATSSPHEKVGGDGATSTVNGNEMATVMRALLHGSLLAFQQGIRG